MCVSKMIVSVLYNMGVCYFNVHGIVHSTSASLAGGERGAEEERGEGERRGKKEKEGD